MSVDLTGHRAVAVEADLGASPDILVNNVGASPSRNFLYMTDDEWMELFELNVMSAVRLTRRFLPVMRKAGWGRVVMINTVAAPRRRAPTSRASAPTRCSSCTNTTCSRTRPCS